MSAPPVTLEESRAQIAVVSGALSRESNPDKRAVLQARLNELRINHVLLRNPVPAELQPETRARLSEIVAGHLLRVAGDDAGTALRRARKNASAKAGAAA